MFPGPASATGWRRIKAAERTANSSLITPALVFTNTSGTNYAFYCRRGGEDKARLSSAESRLFVKCGVSLKVDLQEVSQQKGQRVTDASPLCFSIKVKMANNWERGNAKQIPPLRKISAYLWRNKITAVRRCSKHVYRPLEEGCGISQTPPPRGQQVGSGRPQRGAHKYNNTTGTHTPYVLTTCSTNQSV